MQIWFTIVVVVVLSTWMGYQLLRAVHIAVPTAQILGLGILLGGVLTSLLTLVLLSLNLANELSLVVLAVIAVAMRSGVRARGRHLSSPESDGSVRRVVIKSVGLGLIGLNMFSLWGITLGLSILMLPGAGITELKSQESRRSYSTLVVLTAAAAALGLYTWQPGWWYAQSNDVPFFESLTWSLARFGPDSHPGFLNGSINGYHYLGYLWAGTISDVAEAPPFQVLNIALPFLEVFSISLVLLSSFQNFKEVSKAGSWIVLAFVLGIRYTSFTSSDLATWSLVCYSSLLFASENGRQISEIGNRTRLQVIFGVFGSITVLSKGTTLPIVLALGLATSSAAFGSEIWTNGWRAIRRLPIHLLAVCATAWWWYFGAAKSATFALAEPSPASNLLELGPNNGLWASRDVFQSLPILILLGAFMVLYRRRGDAAFYRLEIVSISVFCLLATGAILLMPAINARIYAQNHALVVLMSLGVITAGRHRVPLTFRLLIPTIIAASAISWADIRFLPGLVERLWSSAPTRWIPLSLTFARLPVSLLVSLFALWVSSSWTRHKREGALSLGLPWPACICMVLALNVGVWTQLNRLDQFPEHAATTSTTTHAFIGAHPDAA
ncbi:MAG: hypothetical protein EBX09_07185, partial [Actinobacteria bacterium]|nr:hypothetical protein [Actinomycetota bacterium]